VYFTRHNCFLESLRPCRRFEELIALAREQYPRFTDDGAEKFCRPVPRLPSPLAAFAGE
jgi:hypothetical protein